MPMKAECAKIYLHENIYNYSIFYKFTYILHHEIANKVGHVVSRAVESSAMLTSSMLTFDLSVLAPCWCQCFLPRPRPRGRAKPRCEPWPKQIVLGTLKGRKGTRVRKLSL